MPYASLITNVSQAGISSGKYSGLPNSVYDMENIDLTTDEDLIQPSKKITENDYANLDSEVVAFVSLPDETILAVCDNGKIHERDTDGNWSLEATKTLTSEKFLNAHYFQQSVYFVSDKKIYRWKIDTTLSDANITEYTTAHPSPLGSSTPIEPKITPMVVISNRWLFIGIGNVISAVTLKLEYTDPTTNADGTKTQPIPTIEHTFASVWTELFEVGNIETLTTKKEILYIGTNSPTIPSKVFYYNPATAQLIDKDDIPEGSVNAVLQIDNLLVFHCGVDQLYILSGRYLQFLAKVPHGTEMPKQNTTMNFHRQPLFCAGNTIWSLGEQINRNFVARILNKPYVLDNKNATITASVAFGSSFIVAYKTDENSYKFGELSEEYGAGFITTRVLEASVQESKKVQALLLKIDGERGGTHSLSLNGEALGEPQVLDNGVLKYSNLPNKPNVDYTATLTLSGDIRVRSLIAYIS